MTMFQIIITICFFTTSINCRGKARMIGGLPTHIIQSFPYQLSLRQNSRHFCGAVIISPIYAITAAHCFVNKRQLENLTLKSGTTSLYLGGNIHKIESVILHPKFNVVNLDYDYDVALLKISEPFVVNSKSKPINLPVSGIHPEVGSTAVVSGWGSTKVNKYVDLPFVSLEDCTKTYEKINPITPRMICAGYERGEKDACQGDSGGPLVQNGTLVGIVSWGIGCARPNSPGMYTLLSYPNIRDWIKDNTGI